jgi:hypothetical protein
MEVQTCLEKWYAGAGESHGRSQLPIILSIQHFCPGNVRQGF